MSLLDTDQILGLLLPFAIFFLDPILLCPRRFACPTQVLFGLLVHVLRQVFLWGGERSVLREAGCQLLFRQLLILARSRRISSRPLAHPRFPTALLYKPAWINNITSLIFAAGSLRVTTCPSSPMVPPPVWWRYAAHEVLQSCSLSESSRQGHAVKVVGTVCNLVGAACQAPSCCVALGQELLAGFVEDVH